MSMTRILTVAVGVGLSFAAASAVMILLFWKQQNEEDYVDSSGRTTVSTARQSVLEVRVPKNSVGAIIGRQGMNIRQIQEETNTRINFNDKDGEDRVAIIRGTPDDTIQAEKLILKIVSNQTKSDATEIFVPEKVCGRIIGRNGETIRNVCTISKASVTVERDGNEKNPDGFRRVTIRGIPDEIDLAKRLIEEIVNEASSYNQRTRFSAHSGNDKQQHLSIKAADEDDTQPYKPNDEQIERLGCTAGGDGFLEVFISAVHSPDQFWVQITGGRSIELDRMVQNITEYYSQSSNRQLQAMDKVEVGDVVAAPFLLDESWYRAKVVSVEEDEYNPEDSKVTVFFVDFGDTNTLPLKALCRLKRGLMNFPFQAIECQLANALPKDSEWTEEAIVAFEKLVYAADWKVIMARPEQSGDEEAQAVCIVELVDTNGPHDLWIANELVKQGFAQFIVKEKKPSK